MTHAHRRHDVLAMLMSASLGRGHGVSFGQLTGSTCGAQLSYVVAGICEGERAWDTSSLKLDELPGRVTVGSFAYQQVGCYTPHTLHRVGRGALQKRSFQVVWRRLEHLGDRDESFGLRDQLAGDEGVPPP